MNTPSPVPTDAQRHELGGFLRTHRETLKPADAGQPTMPQGRRRTPGLRREEVAQLCGISTTWYTWLEQGRDISLSPAALAHLADGLQLTIAERSYLFELARKRDPAPPVAERTSGDVPLELSAVLQATDAPAYLLNRLWSVEAWNDAAKRLFDRWFEGGEANLLRYVFLDPSARDFICDWENRARRLLAEFRAATANRADEPAIKTLVGDLMRSSPSFARFWNTHAVLAREGGARSFNHPHDGLLVYEQVTLIPAAHLDHKLVILLDQVAPRQRRTRSKRSKRSKRT
jgi:transcriptional regulator with XRE-family HTH domain